MANEAKKHLQAVMDTRSQVAIVRFRKIGQGNEGQRTGKKRSKSYSPDQHSPAPFRPFPETRRQAKNWGQKNLLFYIFASIFLPSSFRWASRCRSNLRLLAALLRCALGEKKSHLTRKIIEFLFLRSHLSMVVWNVEGTWASDL